jgi:cell wall-associated NlpC family hydrolase
LLDTRDMRSFVVALSLLIVAALVGCSLEPEGAAGIPSHGTYGADLPNEETDDDLSDGENGIFGDVGDEDTALVGANDDVPAAAAAPAATTTMKATTNLNLRKGPGTSYAILLVIPSGSIVSLVSATQQNGFYNVSYGGSTGWSHSAYLTAVTASPTPSPTVVDPNGAPSADNAIVRAASAVGFSYFWGGGAWVASGATASNKGSCSGSCPSCSHSGSYGADCSGLIAKAWQYGTKALEVNSHPYGTIHFVNDVAGKWSTVSRGAMKKGDALVYNSGGAGHIVLYEKGDGWGTPTVYECKGCSYGCVHNARSFTSSYHAIRRAGF